jgi:hypothetical protein
MHARVATFDNCELRGADDWAGVVRARVAEISGAERHLVLLDRKARSALELTLFESADAARAAEPALERLEHEIPDLVRGRRASVRVYEVGLDDADGEARAARACFVAGPDYHVHDALHAIQDEIGAGGAELDGWKGLVSLADQASGHTVAITFWATDDALRRSEIRETQLRGRVAAAARGSITAVERYDEVLSAVPLVA